VTGRDVEVDVERGEELVLARDGAVVRSATWSVARILGDADVEAEDVADSVEAVVKDRVADGEARVHGGVARPRRMAEDDHGEPDDGGSED